MVLCLARMPLSMFQFAVYGCIVCIRIAAPRYRALHCTALHCIASERISTPRLDASGTELPINPLSMAVTAVVSVVALRLLLRYL